MAHQQTVNVRKYKLQLGEHLIDNQTANASNSIHQQCHDFKQSEKVPISDSDHFLDNFPFQELNSKELIKKQNELCQAQNLIKNKDNAQNFNQNLISDNEGDIF
jgi:hypothetical protein